MIRRPPRSKRTDTLVPSTTLFRSIHDITQRKTSEAAAQRLAAIVESSDDAIVSKDLDGITTSWNRGAERLFGYTAKEEIGQPVTILIPAERHDDEDIIIASIRHGKPVRSEERRDGKECGRTWRARGAPYH